MKNTLKYNASVEVPLPAVLTLATSYAFGKNILEFNKLNGTFKGTSAHLVSFSNGVKF